MPELTERQRNWAPWIGLLFALAAMLSNAGFFLGVPGERAIPWLSLALAIAALVCAVVGVMRAFRQPHSDISRPAEFLVDSNGVVRWTNFTEDIRIRAKSDEMLAVAKGLK